MVAPRAFIFVPLVKGNKDYGDEIGNKTSGTRLMLVTGVVGLSTIKRHCRRKQSHAALFFTSNLYWVLIAD